MATKVTQGLIADIGQAVASQALITSDGGVSARSAEERFSDWHNVLDYGADRAGSTNAATAFAAAITASADANADGRARIYVPRGTYRLSTVLTLPDYCEIRAEDGAKIDARITGTITLGDYCKVSGLHIDGLTGGVSGIRSLYLPAGATHGCVIERCEFTIAASGAGIYGENTNYENEVRDCIFTAGSNGVLLNGSARSKVTGCTFNSVSRAIQFQGAQDCLIENNRCFFGITGILCISLRGNGGNNLTRGNIIQGNLVYGVTEEGISLDSRGNTPASWPENETNPVVTYASHSNTADSTRRINVSESGQAANWAGGYYAIPLTGTNVGMAEPVVTSGDGYIEIYRGNGDGDTWAVGDLILITMPFFGNVIQGNTCISCGYAGVSLWGSCWYNVVKANTLLYCKLQGVQCFSVVAGLGSSGAWGGQAWSGFNTIDSNVIDCTEAGAAPGDAGSPIDVGLAEYGTPIAAVVKHPGTRITNNLISSSKLCRVLKAERTHIEGNQFHAGGGINLDTCIGTYFGRNYRAGLRYETPTTSGGSGLVNALGTTIADLAGGASSADIIAKVNEIIGVLEANGTIDT